MRGGDEQTPPAEEDVQDEMGAGGEEEKAADETGEEVKEEGETGEEGEAEEGQ